MLQECLMSEHQTRFSMENFRNGTALNVANRNATKTPLKPRTKISIFQLGTGCTVNEQLSMQQREYVRLKGSANNANQEPRDHHQSH